MKLILLIHLFLAPTIQILQGQKKEMIVQVTEAREKLEQCVKEGYQAKFEFLAQACVERRGWFDDCQDPRIENTTIKYDTISSTYMLTRDRIGDKLPAQTKSINDANEAWMLAAQTNEISPTFLAYDQQKFINNRNLVVKVRSRANCDGERDPFLIRLTDIITLGIFVDSDIDISWQTFRTSE